MSPQPITGREHKPLDIEEYPAIKEWLAAHSHQANTETLGVYSANDGLRPGNFIGMVWIGEGKNRTVLQVSSKFDSDTERMDYIRMFCECAADPKVSEDFDCLHFWEDDLIDAQRSEDFSLLIAVAYLRELKALCSQHLRRHFLRERENFAGKVKGKILAGENLRRNVLRCRPDRVYCEYQSVSDDILENRILRAALERAARYVASNKIKTKAIQKELPKAQEWIHLCRSRLCGVSIAPIKPRDFAAARKRGVFAHYARPLHLAKAVLRQLGFNPQTELNKSAKTPPYAINSEKLFESFAELKLREIHKNLKVQGDTKGGKGFSVRVIPDFYVARDDDGNALIMDAKYKDTDDFYNGKPAREDMYQVVAYSQHNALLEKIKRQSGETAAPAKIVLSLVYPRLENDPDGKIEQWKTTDAFHSELKIQTVPCPVKPAEEDSKNESNQKAAAGQGGGEPQAGQGEGRQHGDVQKQ